MYLCLSISSQDYLQFGTTCICISQSAVRTFNNLEQHVLVSVNQQSELWTIWNNMYLYQSISSQDFQQFGTTCTCISQSAVRIVNNLEQHVLVSVNQQSGLSTIWNIMYLFQSISSQDFQQFGTTCTFISQSGDQYHNSFFVLGKVNVKLTFSLTFIVSYIVFLLYTDVNVISLSIVIAWSGLDLVQRISRAMDIKVLLQFLALLQSETVSCSIFIKITLKLLCIIPCASDYWLKIIFF